jgi:hypothetical protein
VHFDNLCMRSPQMFLNLVILRNVPRDPGSKEPSFLRIFGVVSGGWGYFLGTFSDQVHAFLGNSKHF